MKSKNIFLTLAFSCLALISFAQAPKKMTYQATIRDNNNTLLTNRAVQIEVGIWSGSVGGTLVYQEVHNVTTNTNGLASIDVGTGKILAGNFTTIDWSTGSFYIETKTDPNGGNNFTIIGSKQLVSVPFAFYAEKSGSGGASTPNGWLQEDYNQTDQDGNQYIAKLTRTLSDIQMTHVNGRPIISANQWNGAWIQAPNAAFNVQSSQGVTSMDGRNIQSFVWDNSIAGYKESDLFVNPYGGNVAVNLATAPKASLTVQRGSTAANPWGTAAFLGSNNITHFNYGDDENTYIRGGKTTSQVVINDQSNGAVLISPYGGSVGIGTLTPGAYKLAVNGTIRAKEIRVNTGWADFVFEKNYKLRPLSEVEAFIKQHKHLPEVPAASEIEGEENGLDVGSMSKVFMQKIEELTLYMIQADKQIEELKKEIEQLKKLNDSIKK